MIPNLLGCWLLDPFLVRWGVNFIQALCITSTLSFLVKTTGGHPRSYVLCGDLLQQYDTRREILSFGTQVWVNLRIILAHTSQPATQSPSQHGLCLQHQPRTECSMDDMNVLRDRCTFFSAGCWELTLSFGLRHAGVIPQVLLPDFWQLCICRLSLLSISQWHADWFL